MMTKWEYRLAVGTGSNLAELGAEGWELAAVEGSTWVFKRPIEVAEVRSMAAVLGGTSEAAAEPHSEAEPVAAEEEVDASVQ